MLEMVGKSSLIQSLTILVGREATTGYASAVRRLNEAKYELN